MMKVSIACPSYKRPKVETLDYIPFCRVYVAPEEAEEYRKQNNGADIVVCPEGVQGNVCRVRNYIMENELKENDAVAIIDDDMQGLYLWSVDTVKKTHYREKIKTEDIIPFIEKYSEMCDQAGLKLWGGNCNMDALSYREYSPFSFVGYIGSPFMVFLKGNECMFDERFSLKEDYDMTLQQCNKYRGCLRLNFFTYNVKQGLQAGGCATYRNFKREKEQFDLLQKKWGSKIVKEDKSNKGKSQKKKIFDYNPIIKVPIKGI